MDRYIELSEIVDKNKEKTKMLHEKLIEDGEKL